MKIGDAQKAYREQLSLLRGQRSDFVKQREENRKKMEQAANTEAAMETPEGAETVAAAEASGG